MSKLVRDRIPEIIEKSGMVPVYFRAKPSAMLDLLLTKLQEEVNELKAAEKPEDRLEEAADVYEVLTNILFTLGYDTKALQVKAMDKRFERGAFIKGYVLEDVKGVAEVKYGYQFHDWNLWSVDKIVEIHNFDEDFVINDRFGRHEFDHKTWCYVKLNNGESVPYIKEHIFDTEEEANEYGKRHSGCFII